MKPLELVAQSIETALNRYLHLGPDPRPLPPHLAGKTLGIVLRGFAGRLVLQPRPERVYVWLDAEMPCAAEIEATPLGMAALLRDPQQAIQGDSVHVRGETRSAQELGEWLQASGLDWEALLARLTTDGFAAAMRRQFNRGSRWLRQRREAWQADLGAYLQDETATLPARAEVEAWLTEVDTLRDDVARLQARLDLLTEALPTARHSG